MKYIPVLFLNIAFIFIGCQKDNFNPNKDKTITNVPYGSDAAQKMDVFLPANRNTQDTKMFVWIHGGAWYAGDKSEGAGIKSLLDPYLGNYAYASLNYRLYNTNTVANKFPTQENDVKLAVEYILSQAEKWQISDRIVIAGQSAGGHLALLQAYKYNSNGNIKAVVAYYPPTELTAAYHLNAFIQLTLNSVIGGSPDMSPEMYQSSSPLTYLNAQSVPTVFFHGTIDDVVPIAQSDTLKAKLTQVGVPYDYMYIQNEGHGFTEPSVKLTIEKATDFLDSHVN